MPTSGTDSGLPLPPPPARAAIVLGFLLGTWMTLDGAHRLIVGDYIRWHGQLGPWAAWAAAVGLRSWVLAALILGLGALWLTVPNLYLFQNRKSTWAGMLLLIAASSWYVGGATPVLLAQVVLLLLPSTRRAFR